MAASLYLVQKSVCTEFLFIRICVCSEAKAVELKNLQNVMNYHYIITYKSKLNNKHSFIYNAEISCKIKRIQTSIKH